MRNALSSFSPARRPRRCSLPAAGLAGATAALPALLGLLLLTGGFAATAAHAQRQEFDGAAVRQHAKVQQDRALDLNGDGNTDDREIELAVQNEMLQRAMDSEGKVDKEKLRALQAQRKRLVAEARILDDEKEILEKKAQGKKLTAKEEEKLRLAGEIREREKRERAARAATQNTQSAASQKLSKPIIDY